MLLVFCLVMPRRHAPCAQYLHAAGQHCATQNCVCYTNHSVPQIIRCSPRPMQEIVAAEQRNKVVSKLHAILKPFVLRRLKSDVEISLPRKMELVLYAGMTDVQKQLNQQMVDGKLLVGGAVSFFCFGTVQSVGTVVQNLVHVGHMVPPAGRWGSWFREVQAG